MIKHRLRRYVSVETVFSMQNMKMCHFLTPAGQSEMKFYALSKAVYFAALPHAFSTGGLSQILCKHRNAVQIEQNLFKAEVAQAAAALFSK